MTGAAARAPRFVQEFISATHADGVSANAQLRPFELVVEPDGVVWLEMLTLAIQSATSPSRDAPGLTAS